MQHLRQRALGQRACTDLQNLGKYYIRLSCRALPLILRNGRNEEVWNSHGELNRVSFSGEPRVSRPPQSSQIKANKLQQRSLLWCPFPFQSQWLHCTRGAEPVRCAPEAASGQWEALLNVPANRKRLWSKHHARVSPPLRHCASPMRGFNWLYLATWPHRYVCWRCALLPSPLLLSLLNWLYR